MIRRRPRARHRPVRPGRLSRLTGSGGTGHDRAAAASGTGLAGPLPGHYGYLAIGGLELPGPGHEPPPGPWLPGLGRGISPAMTKERP